MRHAVDVVEGETGVGERLLDHRGFERATEPVELTRGRDVVGDADDRRCAAHRYERVAARSRATASYDS